MHEDILLKQKEGGRTIGLRIARNCAIAAALGIRRSLFGEPASTFSGALKPDKAVPFQFSQKVLNLIARLMAKNFQQVLKLRSLDSISDNVAQKQCFVCLSIKPSRSCVECRFANLRIKPLGEKISDPSASSYALYYSPLFQSGKPGTKRSPYRLSAIQKIDDDQIFRPQFAFPWIVAAPKEANQFRVL